MKLSLCKRCGDYSNEYYTGNGMVRFCAKCAHMPVCYFCGKVFHAAVELSIHIEMGHKRHMNRIINDELQEVKYAEEMHSLGN